MKVGMNSSPALYQRIAARLLFVAAVGSSSPAWADAGSIAQTVLNEIKAVAGPAALLVVLWFGVLILTKRASLVLLLTCLVGLIIVRAGGLI